MGHEIDKMTFLRISKLETIYFSELHTQTCPLETILRTSSKDSCVIPIIPLHVPNYFTLEKYSYKLRGR